MHACMHICMDVYRCLCINCCATQAVYSIMIMNRLTIIGLCEYVLFIYVLCVCVCLCVFCNSPAPACFLMALNILSLALKIILCVYNFLTHTRVRLYKWRDIESNSRMLKGSFEYVTEYNSSGTVLNWGWNLSQCSTLEGLKWYISKCWWGQTMRIGQCWLGLQSIRHDP